MIGWFFMIICYKFISNFSQNPHKFHVSFHFLFHSHEPGFANLGLHHDSKEDCKKAAFNNQPVRDIKKNGWERRTRILLMLSCVEPQAVAAPPLFTANARQWS